VKWKVEGRCGVYMCGKESCDLAIERMDGERRDSFIANALFKILRKLPPLHVSDFVRRIPLLLQTLTHRSTQLALLQAVYNTAYRMIQQMRQLSLLCALLVVAMHATPNNRSDTKL
jgi:hypothetical protein